MGTPVSSSFSAATIWDSALRQAQDPTQEELGSAVCTSNRMMPYYEVRRRPVPVPILVEFARALKVSTDTLLGVTHLRERRSPETARLPKRLQQIEELPPADQRIVLKLVDALVDARRRTAPATRARNAS